MLSNMPYVQNIFCNNRKSDSYIINLNFYFTIYTIPFTVRILARYEVLIWKSVNLNIQISFYRGLKN